MYDSDSKGISYTAGFFMTITFTIASVILAAALSTQLWQAITGTPYSSEALMNPAYGSAAKLTQIITAVVGFLLPAIFTANMLSRRPFQLLGFARGVTPSLTGLVIFIMASAMLVSGALSWFTDLIPIPGDWKVTFDKLEEAYQKQVEVIVTLDTPVDFIIALFIMAFLPALCEEALFRGGLQNFLTRSTRSPWLSIVVVSLIFSAFHFSWYGFLSRFFLGVVLGYIFQYSGRLWLSIIAHFFNNALAVTLLYIAKQKGKPLEQAMNEGADSYWGIFALPVVVVLFMIFRNLILKQEDGAR